MTKNDGLDFIVRTDVTTGLADWPRSKAQHSVSLLYGSASNLRDLGIAIKGDAGGYNQHDNIVVNSGRAVHDIHRRMVGGDLRVELPRTGVRLYGLGGGGQVRDDMTEAQQDEAANQVRKDHDTLALSYHAGEHVKVRLNDVLRRNEDPAHPDQAALKNDVVLVNCQAAL